MADKADKNSSSSSEEENQVTKGTFNDNETELSPWKAKGVFNKEKYDRLVEKFGVQRITPDLLKRFEKVTGHKPHYWLTREIFFAHRQLEEILDDHEQGKPVFLYTGRGPSGTRSLHLGHIISYYFTAWLQKVFNAFVVIQMADDEKYYFKDQAWEEIYNLGFENAKDIIACGFNPKRTFIFSNRDYSRNKCVQDIVSEMWKKTNVNTIQAIFGLKGNSCIGQLNWPIYQTAAAFSPYYEKVIGTKENIRCLVAYAIDQDPYFRLGRDIAPKMGFFKPCSIMMVFLPALVGGEKMSSTGDSPIIYMTDTPKEIYDKVKKYAFSGGQGTKELHQKLGGNCEIDVSYQYLRYFMEDEKKLAEIRELYSTGKMLSGEIKKIMASVVTEIVLKHQKDRELVTDDVLKEFYSYDKNSQ